MWHLYQFPLCPFSRKVRLHLAEKGMAYELVREDPWRRRDEFLNLNPAGRVPVLREDDKNIVLADSRAICEFIEESFEGNAMIFGNALQRAEIRRLVALFDEHLYGDVTAPLLQEKMKKRLVTREPPDARVLREAMKLAHEHLYHIDWLVDNRAWLGGPRLSLADLAAAAQLSVADYLGALDWRGHDQAKSWYSVMKSRPSFRPLLAEKMDTIQPASNYADVNW
ncbi:glutathione S-transferase family protein [Pseudoblastomonas halimionae]|uniref:Glutathione S-transferase family protein n=1 Tax=Alteriqipengyuania halimionae TaxID=1926630 RepID=A0A6I4U2M6_9SPHN|nr:glutathione S-transferase family protein [Alteriqipengyuania halimionae]MXP10270.1 glutathione S-transferase family protein [Alteriqipengyuania halimionae]